MSIGSLDALRGVLAIIVLIAHMAQVFLGGGGVALGMAARASVLCFFCLSGYVIAMSIHANRARFGTFDLAEFAAARFARIVPPLVAVILLTVALQAVLVAAGSDRTNIEGAARARFMTSASGQILAILSLCTAGELTGKWLNGPLWSLTYEIQLYVVAGLVATIAFGARHLKPLAVFGLVMYWSHVGNVGLLIPIPTVKGVCFLAFAMGSACFALRDMPARTVLPIGLSALTACGLMVPYFGGDMDIDATPWLRLQSVLALAFGMGLIQLARAQAPAYLARLGGFSYTLYIGHFPVLLFVFFLTEARGVVPAIIAGTVTVALLAWLAGVVERPKVFRLQLQQALARQPRRGAARDLQAEQAVDTGSEMKPITEWHRLVSYLDEYQFNHLEDGHAQTDKPAPKTPEQKSWAGSAWRRYHAWLTSDVPPRVVRHRPE